MAASGSGAVIASLRGKIHSLERALREKESALAAIKREVNTTRLKEMEIQCEIYIGEINRCVLFVDRGTGTCIDLCACGSVLMCTLINTLICAMIEFLDKKLTLLSCI